MPRLGRERECAALNQASISSEDLTRMLEAVQAGEPGASEQLAAAIYDALRAMAQRQIQKDMGRDARNVTIQPTLLADEAFMKLIHQRQKYDNTGHFFALANQVMMRVLLDYHRAHKALKRGGGAVRVSWNDSDHHDGADATSLADVEAIDAALAKLAQLDPRKADVVRYRIFWGLTVTEVAQSLGVARATIERDWAFAKAFLAKELA